MKIIWKVLSFLFCCFVSQFFCYFVLDDIIVHFIHSGQIVYVVMRIIIALILYFTVRFFLTKNSSKKEMDVIFVMYALFILVIIFFKGDRYTSNSLRINMNPLEILNDFKTADNTIFLLLGNIVLYIPFGFYFPFRISFLKPKFLIPLFFVIPLLSESIQLIAGVGVFDINDIILNFLGFMMGFGGFRIACKRHKINT